VGETRGEDPAPPEGGVEGIAYVDGDGGIGEDGRLHGLGVDHLRRAGRGAKRRVEEVV